MISLASATVTTALTLASTPVVRGAVSAGTGIYYGKQGYNAIKNRKKNKILKKKSSDRDRFVENLMCEKAYYEQCNKLKKKLDALEELHNKFVEKRILKFWKIKTRSRRTTKAATLIQDSDSDSDSDNESLDLFLDQMEAYRYTKATMIQKIYRGYRQRIKYPGYPHTRRAMDRWDFTPFDLECARFLYESDDD